MPAAPVIPSAKSAAIRAYRLALAQMANVGAGHEAAVRAAFDRLIEGIAAPLGWTLVREYSWSRKDQPPLRLDAVLVDDYRLVHGVIEAKDNADDLCAEFRAKLKAGYPAKNTLFWQPKRVLLVQNGEVVRDLYLDAQIEQLVEILEKFFAYTEPAIADWERASEEFRGRVAELGKNVRELIQRARGVIPLVAPNKKFQAAFADFAALCRAAINPGLSDDALEEMLIQHLLTARLFGTVFQNPDFLRRNVIAVEIEKVMDALASGHFSRAAFLKKLDRFYLAIERAAETLADFSEKQRFLNTVYERFFQGFAVKVADTLGIVYTPPAIVRFMLEGIRQILKRGFRKDLGDAGVHFLDPFTGTGNFLVHLLRELPAESLRRKYAGELWANEIMLLPYYVAALNIEHEYFLRTGEYEPLPGLCLVDTFELAEPREREFEFMTAGNTERVNAQKKAPIRVILGNPPYNANQQDENDNNKNRKYRLLDQRIRETYAADSTATLRNKLYDPYLRAIRWASDRIGPEGIVAFITNNNYLDAINADGVRKNLVREFDAIFLVDLGGNIRKGQNGAGNVFGITVGVCIAFFIRRPRKRGTRNARIYYLAAEDRWNRAERLAWLDRLCTRREIRWKQLRPDAKGTWLRDGMSARFGKYLSIGSRAGRAANGLETQTIFRTYSLGINTARDRMLYAFDLKQLLVRAEELVEDYNAEVSRWQRRGRPSQIDDFVKYDRVKWSETLKKRLMSETFAEFTPAHQRMVLYRPYTRKWLYADPALLDRPGSTPDYFSQGRRNVGFVVNDIGQRVPFTALATSIPVDLHVAASQDGFQCFPLYTYSEDGTRRRDNVTDWALEQFRAKYPQARVTKEAIFHYVYAVLHHPQYRERYAANLRRELPRIPFAPDFAAFAEAGRKLVALHVGYETQKEFRLRRVGRPGVPADFRVERMKLAGDGRSLVFNQWLTLEGIPAEAAQYRLGNRSALEWVVDQHRVERDEAGRITSDPNRPDDPEYILRLVGQVVTVSVESVRLVAALPAVE